MLQRESGVVLKQPRYSSLTWFGCRPHGGLFLTSALQLTLFSWAGAVKHLAAAVIERPVTIAK